MISGILVGGRFGTALALQGDMSHATQSIEPEVILPEQFWSRPAPAPAGELNLLWNVLLDGIRCYQEAVYNGSTRSADFREVEKWILSRDASQITSFESLCELFSVNPDQARLRLVRLRKRYRGYEYSRVA